MPDPTPIPEPELTDEERAEMEAASQALFNQMEGRDDGEPGAALPEGEEPPPTPLPEGEEPSPLSAPEDEITPEMQAQLDRLEDEEESAGSGMIEPPEDPNVEGEIDDDEEDDEDDEAPDMLGFDSQITDLDDRVTELEIAEEHRIVPSAAEFFWGKASANWTDAAGNASYVDVHPCDNSAGDNETAATVRVYLPRYTPGEDPNVRDDQVIPYYLDANGTAICPANTCDGTKLKTVALWSGTVANIATDRPGWQLANGTNGTPDLRNRFVVGAGDTYALGATGGYLKHGTTENDHSTHDDHTIHDHDAHADHTIADHAAHTHTSGTGDWSQISATPHEVVYMLNGNDDAAAMAHAGGAAPGLQHAGHSAHAAGDAGAGLSHTAHSDADNRPPYYALAYIIRLS